MSQIRCARSKSGDVGAICIYLNLSGLRACLYRLCHIRTFILNAPVSPPSTATFRLKFTDVPRRGIDSSPIYSRQDMAFAPVDVTRTHVIADGC